MTQEVKDDHQPRDEQSPEHEEHDAQAQGTSPGEATKGGACELTDNRV